MLSGRNERRVRKMRSGSWLTLAACFVAGCSRGGNYVEGTADPPGKVNAFDPSASLHQVASFAGGGARLVSIDARGVRSDGTMDLEAVYYPAVEYAFVRPAAPVDRSKYPVGTRPESKDELAVVAVRKSSVVNTTSSQLIDRGMAITKTSPVAAGNVPTAEPQCTFAALWSAAIGRGVPRDAVAHVTYEKSAYRFEVENTPHTYAFDASCKFATATTDPTITPAATVAPSPVVSAIPAAAVPSRHR
jgi:hypothetical protein